MKLSSDFRNGAKESEDLVKTATEKDLPAKF